MKLLFIFEPYDWSHCGGAIGVVAEDVGEAIKLLKSSPDYIDHDFYLSPPIEKQRGWDTWLLTHVVGAEMEDKSYILFDNYNYA